MIQLDEYSPILRSAFLERLSGPLVEIPLDLKAGDFDGSENAPNRHSATGYNHDSSRYLLMQCLTLAV